MKNNNSEQGQTAADFTISNGVKVIHRQISGNPLVTIEAFFRGGIINEPAGRSGITNLTQLLLAQGTRTRGAEALAADIENIGAGIISDISYDYASIGISSMDENAERAAELLSDIIANPAFEQKEIDKEKSNVLAAIKSRKDQISTVAADTFNQAFYGAHPYGRPEQGSEASVLALTRDDIAGWHSGFYASNNMVLVIAGSIDLRSARALSEKYFSVISTGALPAPASKPAVPGARAVKKMTGKFQQAFLMEGFPAPRAGERDFFTLKVLNSLLGGRMTGRLFMELREKLSLAYEVSSYYPSRAELSRFVIYIGLDRKNLPLASKRIAEIIDDLKKNPVPERDLEDTKNFIKGIYLLDRQTAGRTAWYLGWWEIMGMGYKYDDNYLSGLMSVTADDIQKAALKYFSANKVAVQIMPGKEPPKKKAPEKRKAAPRKRS